MTVKTFVMIAVVLCAGCTRQVSEKREMLWEPRNNGVELVSEDQWANSRILVESAEAKAFLEGLGKRRVTVEFLNDKKLFGGDTTFIRIVSIEGWRVPPSASIMHKVGSRGG